MNVGVKSRDIGHFESKKDATVFLRCQMLADFVTFFTVRISSKLVLKSSLKVLHTLNMLPHYLVKYLSSF